MRAFRRTAVLVMLAALLPAAGHAADVCTGKIGKLPAVITKPGVWCLKKNFAIADPLITAIDIRTDDVTIDCAGFTLDGRAAGIGTSATAISANGPRSNITIRGCTIRGFQLGISIFDNELGSGHLVEDNLIEGSTRAGIYVLAKGAVVRRNRVLDTGGAPNSDRSTAITVLGDAIDNVVDGMAGAPDVANFSPEGLYAGGVGNFPGVGFLVEGNRVRNLVPKGTGFARGIVTAATSVSIRGNTVAQPSTTTGQGFFCSIGGFARDNEVTNYTTPNQSCSNIHGNVGF